MERPGTRTVLVVGSVPELQGEAYEVIGPFPDNSTALEWLQMNPSQRPDVVILREAERNNLDLILELGQRQVSTVLFSPHPANP